MIIAEQLGGPAAFLDSEWPRCEYANRWYSDAVEFRRGRQEAGARTPHRRRALSRHRFLNALRQSDQAIVTGQVEAAELVGLQVLGPGPRRFRQPIREHRA